MSKVKPNYIKDQKTRTRYGWIDSKSPNVSQLVPFEKIEYKPETPYKVVAPIDNLEKERLKIYDKLSSMATWGKYNNHFICDTICVPNAAYKTYEQTKDVEGLLKACAEFEWTPEFIESHVFLHAEPIMRSAICDGTIIGVDTGRYKISHVGRWDYIHCQNFIVLLNKYKAVVAELETWRDRV